MALKQNKIMRPLCGIIGNGDFLNKATKKTKQILFSRVIVCGLLIIAQLALLLYFIIRLSRYFAALYGFFLLLSMIVALYVVNEEGNPSYKLAWVVPIMMFPLVGGVLYLLFGHPRLSSVARAHMRGIQEKIDLPSSETDKAKTAVSLLSKERQNESKYISKSGYPPFCNTSVEYLSPGEKKLEALLEAINSAKRFILLEYFIIEEGEMWNSIHEALRRKVSEGVSVKVIYDGFGCLLTLPDDYFKTLSQEGIECVKFNPLIPVVSMMMNNRDHRKIAVIDGEIGFMGGINLADEYINRKNRLGHWKDSAVKLKGEAVYALTAMFLEMWDAVSGDESCIDEYRVKTPSKTESGAVVQPYSDTPLDNEQVAEGVYLNLISHAKNYLYICTPYLIIDNELITALSLSAKSGVDVRIITPHHGDKWYVHIVTRAYYPQLVRAGIRIYEYTPGFIHSKVFVSDDEVATVGTVNLDYRSLYLHFECGVWFNDNKAVCDIKQDFLETLERCEEITTENKLLKYGAVKKIISDALRLFAPLM